MFQPQILNRRTGVRMYSRDEGFYALNSTWQHMQIKLTLLLKLAQVGFV